MIIAQVSVAPIGVGIELHEYIKAALEQIEKSGVRYELNAMATVIEAEDIDTLLKVVKEAHQAVIDKGAKRVITEVKIDDRRDKEATIESKIKAVQ
ncbi:MAG TPA: MTH1187 family thiamine-binding protein [Thermoplasmatales archaeon]|nr:MTH1187 family thiamine-binding protein [Thermoplasmatales archaeon]